MSATVHEAAARMTADNIAWLPVTGPSGLVGVVSAGDIVRRSASQGKPPTECKVFEVMTLGVIYCRGSDTVMTALRLMNSRLVYQLGVLDATGHLTGVVTAHDLIAAILTSESEKE